MADSFVIGVLVSFFEDEIKNTITHTDTEIIVELDNGKKVKISAKNVA